MERTTAAVYLAGYSVECMLKALILSAVPQAQEAALLARFRGARAHDYEWLLELYAEQGGARLPASVVPTCPGELLVDGHAVYSRHHGRARGAGLCGGGDCNYHLADGRL